jgi:hypothetical protein
MYPGQTSFEEQGEKLGPNNTTIWVKSKVPNFENPDILVFVLIWYYTLFSIKDCLYSLDFLIWSFYLNIFLW